MERDRCSPDLRINSPWRFSTSLLQPVRYKTPYDSELDRALREGNTLAENEPTQVRKG